jgi:hypothetical protein
MSSAQNYQEEYCEFARFRKSIETRYEVAERQRLALKAERQRLADLELERQTMIQEDKSAKQDHGLVMTSQFVTPGRTVFETSGGDPIPNSKNIQIFLVRVPANDTIDTLANTFSRCIGPVKHISIHLLDGDKRCAFIHFDHWSDNVFTQTLWAEIIICSQLNKFRAPCQRTCCELFYIEDYMHEFYRLVVSTGLPETSVVVESKVFTPLNI